MMGNAHFKAEITKKAKIHNACWVKVIKFVWSSPFIRDGGGC